MIISENYGGGKRWYCTKCDVRKEHLTTVTWTNSKPPVSCSRCTSPAEKNQELVGVARSAAWKLSMIYGDRFVIPGSVPIIADLVSRNNLSGGANPHQLAAIINQLC